MVHEGFIDYYLYHCNKIKPDTGTVRSKNISPQSNEILVHFNEMEKPCFRSSEAFEVLSKSSKPAVNQLLSDMAKRGLLMRIKDGVYYVVPYEKDPERFMPDSLQLAENLVNGADHYIGYYSALQILNLISRPSIKQQIEAFRKLWS